MPADRDAAELLRRRVATFTEVDPDGCWLWRGALDRSGYGALTVQGRSLKAHRASYEVHVGPIPNGLHIDHLCRVHNCVRPDHLEPVTNRENVLRGESPVAIVHREGICRRGHGLTPENSYTPPKRPTERHCRECKRLADRRRDPYRRRKS